jgi:MFS family permease
MEPSLVSSDYSNARIGSLLAAWTTYGTRDNATSWAWRIPSIIQLAIPVVVLGGVLIAPESPRWLASKGRFDEVRACLVKYHAGGDEASPLVEFELEEIRSTLALESQFKQATSYADMLRTKGNRHRTFISVTMGMFSQWNGVGIAGYYLSPVLTTLGVTSVTSQTMISGFLQIWNLILAVSAAFSVDRLGRRKLFLISCLGMLGSYICITALSASFAHTLKAAVGVAVIPFLFIFYGFYDIAFTPLLVSYTCEIWPYDLRARGVGVMFISTNLAVFFNIFINPIALEAIQWKYYLVYVILLALITTTIYFCYPETNGHTLEEMARVFDGEDAAVPKEGRVQEVIAERTASVSHYDKGMNSSHVEI